MDNARAAADGKTAASKVARCIRRHLACRRFARRTQNKVEFKQFEINEPLLSAGKTTAFQFVRAVLR